MGILFCIFKYFPFGGLQRDFLRIACECHERGYKVIVYTFSWEGDIPKGFDIRLVPDKRYTNHGKAAFFSKWVMKELRRNSYHAVVGFNRIKGLDVYFAGDNCLQEKTLYDKSFFYKLTPRFLTYSAFEKAVFNPSAKVEILALTERQKSDYIKHYSTQEERFHLLPPGISFDHAYPLKAEQIRKSMRENLRITDDKIVLLQVGSGFKTKGVDRSIRALAALPEIIRNKIVFLIIGKGHSRGLINLSRSLGIKQQVIFLGRREDVPKLLIASDLMIHPARNEATGTVLIEALAARLPILCTATCGYSRYVREAKAGKIIPEPFKQEALNQALLNLVTDKEKLLETKKNILNYSGKEDFYNRHKFAADIIEEVIKIKNERAHRIIKDIRAEKPPFKPDFIYLREDFQEVWQGKDPFVEADKLRGQIFRQIKNRRTLQFELNDKRFFVKIHHAIGWGEIFKNFLQFKTPVIGAGNEWAAINKLNELNVDTMTACAFGQHGNNPAKQESFLITETLENTISLEEFCKNWKNIPPMMALKCALIRKVAGISRQLHTNGINHRDYYICHFLMDLSCGIENITTGRRQNIKIYLIDLHRTQMRKKTPSRWIIKDIAGIWFSSMDIGLTKKDCFRFMKIYSNSSLRDALTKNRSFWINVNNTAKRLYKKDHGKTPNIDWEKHD